MPDKEQLDDMQEELARRINAMARLCVGMSTEDMENAPFTYQSLLQIVQRREGRVPLSALVLPSLKTGIGLTDYMQGEADGHNNAIEAVQHQINQLMEQAK